MKVVNLTIVKLSLCYAIGIITAHLYSIEYFVLTPLIAGMCLLIFLWWFTKKRLNPSILFGILALFLFFGTGFVNYQLRLPQHSNHHYTQFTSSENTQRLTLKITEQLQSDRYHDKYLAEVLQVHPHTTEGRLLLYLQKDSSATSIAIDQELLVLGDIKAIPGMLNPGQFDYRKYMQNLDVYGQLRISSEHIVRQKQGSPTLRGMSERLRSFAISKLAKTRIPLDERSILQALVLGQKKELSADLKQQYADAGAIHILAVSGLHVGIIFLLFNFLTKPLTHLPKGHIVQSIVIVLALWCFAFLTGLSPSVCRAVTMFSFLAISQLLGRHNYAMNTLFLSFLLLLLLQPTWLFHVGFQLSYLAVFFIVWTQPMLASLWRPRYKIVRFFWGIMTVSIAAQLGVLPLSLYYFHQVPGLFLVSNLVILPVLGFLLGFGILIILLACLEILPGVVSDFYAQVLQQLNGFIGWVAAQENFILRDISFSIEKVVVVYALTISILLLCRRFSFRRVLYALGILWICIMVVFLEEIKATSEFVVFQKSKKTLIAIKQGKHLTLFNRDSTISKDDYPLKNYLTSNQLNTIQKKVLPSVFKYQGETFLILDSLAVFPKQTNIDYVILINSPKVNLNRLIKSIHPGKIIADGSNYYSYVQRWKTSCEKAETPFHYTKEVGAFILKRNPD